MIELTWRDGRNPHRGLYYGYVEEIQLKIFPISKLILYYACYLFNRLFSWREIQEW
ncbi:hypothetical protein HMPREF3221_00350 [Fusobacterium nucleatum]|uniref:Uncharacterized protein n=1 Tax=Fusobacterium nucleatum TaxID=851 RepID=A0A133P9A8_FUSNU|nr:hypothetical protein HMPREF3221_00350 [Fusobacterium nucleatum]